MEYTSNEHLFFIRVDVQIKKKDGDRHDGFAEHRSYGMNVSSYTSEQTDSSTSTAIRQERNNYEGIFC